MLCCAASWLMHEPLAEECSRPLPQELGALPRKTVLPPLLLVTVTAIAVASTLVISAARAADGKESGGLPEAVRVEALLRSGTTTSGDPISVPEGPLEVIVSKYHVPPHASLPVHQHPFPRYGYVIAGELRATNTETSKSKVFRAGSFIVEDVGRWHAARNLGAKLVELLVIDLVKPAASNVISKD